MTTCPVCMNEANNDGDCCSVCGYHFQDATEAFEAISIDTEGERAHAADQAPASLRVCYGKQEGLVFPLESDFIEIGRSPQCGVMLNDMTVSRVHAEMEKINGEWTITDRDSFNGVWVNNEAIKNAVLNPGDLLQIGRFVLRFVE